MRLLTFNGKAGEIKPLTLSKESLCCVFEIGLTEIEHLLSACLFGVTSKITKYKNKFQESDRSFQNEIRIDTKILIVKKQSGSVVDICTFRFTNTTKKLTYFKRIKNPGFR